MTPRPWLPYVATHFEIRALLAERMECGATDELDRKLMALIERVRGVERAGWFS